MMHVQTKRQLWGGVGVAMLCVACTKNGAMDRPPDQADANASEPRLGLQLDRAGRVAVSTGLIQVFNSDANAKLTGKQAYNRAGAESWADYRPEIAANLAIFDGLDTVCGNQLLAGAQVAPDRYAPLAQVLADDQLYLDTSRGTCGQYLGLEAEVVGALPQGQGGCGGRTPVDDVIGVTYSVLAIGALSGLDDTVTSDGADHDPARFPFLASPAPAQRTAP